MSLDIKKQIEKLYTKFNDINNNYMNVDKHLDNILEDVKKLEHTHKEYVTLNEKNINLQEYCIYIDDIFFQSKLLRSEYNFFKQIITINKKKLYKDIFRLYKNIVKRLSLNIFDNIDINFKYTTTNQSINHDIIKKKYFSKIKFFNEIKDDNEYDMSDIKNIYDEFIKRLDELYKCENTINKFLTDVHQKYEEGLLLQTFMISLNGEKDKLLVDHKVFLKILDSVLNIHARLSTKYEVRISIISEEILNTPFVSESNNENTDNENNNKKDLTDGMSIYDEIKNDYNKNEANKNEDNKININEKTIDNEINIETIYQN